MIPNIELNFKFARNSLNIDIEREKWIEWLFPFSGMSRENFDRLVCSTEYAVYFYPFCLDLSRYEMLWKVMFVFFVLDEHTEADWGDGGYNDKATQMIWHQFKEVLDRLSEGNHVIKDVWKPYILCFHILMKNVFSNYNDIQIRRAALCWSIYADGSLEENQYKNNKNKVLNFEEMLVVYKFSFFNIFHDLKEEFIA